MVKTEITNSEMRDSNKNWNVVTGQHKFHYAFWTPCILGRMMQMNCGNKF